MQTMNYVCDVCGWMYDAGIGVPDQDVAAGTNWVDIPDDFLCPLCSAGKDQFSKAD